MSTIVSNNVTLSQSWGASFGDYSFVTGNEVLAVDFQDLMVKIAEKRATTVEAEVEPLTTRITNRNTTLEALGNALSDLTKIQASFKSDAEGSKRSSLSITTTTFTTLQDVFGTLDFDNRKMLKYEVEEWLKKVKSKIDALNNEAQKDMTRLQQLVDRRDESFSTATTLMSAISDTRSTAIRNM